MASVAILVIVCFIREWGGCSEGVLSQGSGVVVVRVCLVRVVVMRVCKVRVVVVRVCLVRVVIVRVCLVRVAG